MATSRYELAYTLDGDTRVVDLHAQHVQLEVLPGETVDAYAYNGMVPGPVVRATEATTSASTSLTTSPSRRSYTSKAPSCRTTWTLWSA